MFLFYLMAIVTRTEKTTIRYVVEILVQFGIWEVWRYMESLRSKHGILLGGNISMSTQNTRKWRTSFQWFRFQFRI